MLFFDTFVNNQLCFKYISVFFYMWAWTVSQSKTFSITEDVYDFGFPSEPLNSGYKVPMNNRLQEITNGLEVFKQWLPDPEWIRFSSSNFFFFANI